ncbi:uncharacterized protein LOC129919200 [Episyrphus balteatus]|uniref:uncharacterized protein LOC129919200 n=1 Tax=Episyrphus balteatus TaxID=286459 RepID=UPI0024859E16|nr:uncharacterized protein LOC129919200 [Episyrphus balteatus]
MGVSEWLLVLTGIVTALYFWVKHHYGYWRRQNVPCIETNPIFGNLKELICMTVNPAVHVANLYNHKNAQDQPVVGIHVFHKPALLLRDLDLIKTIMIKDFNKFSNRYGACDPHGDPLGHLNIFFAKNPLWKEMRTKLTPVFTTGKLKQMFPLIAKIGVELDNYLCKTPLDSTNCIKEVKEISALFTTDVIASVAYGLDANCLKNPQSEFRQQGSKIFKWDTFKTIQFNGIFFLPEFVSFFGWKTFTTEAASFIRNTISYVMDERQKSGAVRNDLIDTLVALKKEAAIAGEKLTDEVLIAQAAVFFTAGFETTSSTISFGLYELSKKQEVQTRLREEIKEFLEKNGGNITYDALQEMEYLNMVTLEILRLYPSLPFLDRECTLSKDETEYSLKPYSDISVPHGMPIYISTYAIHKDPQYFANPEEFDPERFSAENRPNLTPNSYMPFGAGPHSCIGERLGIIKAKIGLINFLRNHYVLTCEKTEHKLTFDPKAVLLSAKGGLYCKLVRDPLFVEQKFQEYLVCEQLVLSQTAKMIPTVGLLVIIGLLTILYIWMKYQFSYWKRQNVAYVEPLPLIGNLKGMLSMTSSPAEQLADLYNHENVKDQPAFGAYMFNKPALIVRDPELAKTILIKEYNRFADRHASVDHNDTLAYNNLFFIKSPYWKEMRTKVSPVFTTGKLKQMFPLIEEVGYELHNYVSRLTKDTKSSIQELKDISALYSTDVIASVAFGLNANSLKDPNSEFRRNGKPIFTWTPYKAIQFIFIFFVPALVKLLRIRVFSEEGSKFLRNSINFVMTDRKKSGIPRNDLIDILVEMKKTAETEGECVDTDKFVAQAAIFFTAGFETSSSVISFGLHELSRKPEVQKRLREEIKESLIKTGGKITYESLNEMEYLSMVVQEVLRMYPPQPFLDRKCTLDENEKEFSLKPHIDFNIPNGMGVFFPIFAMQRDPKYFPNPDEFDPERFSAENKPNIPTFSFLSFGVGPRACIGERLGLFQSKMGIVNFLRGHYVEPCDKSHTKMKLDPKGMLLSANGGVYVNLVRDPLLDNN